MYNVLTLERNLQDNMFNKITIFTKVKFKSFSRFLWDSLPTNLTRRWNFSEDFVKLYYDIEDIAHDVAHDEEDYPYKIKKDETKTFEYLVLYSKLVSTSVNKNLNNEPNDLINEPSNNSAQKKEEKIYYHNKFFQEIEKHRVRIKNKRERIKVKTDSNKPCKKNNNLCSNIFFISLIWMGITYFMLRHETNYKNIFLIQGYFAIPIWLFALFFKKFISVQEPESEGNPIVDYFKKLKKRFHTAKVFVRLSSLQKDCYVRKQLYIELSSKLNKAIFSGVSVDRDVISPQRPSLVTRNKKTFGAIPATRRWNITSGKWEWDLKNVMFNNTQLRDRDDFKDNTSINTYVYDHYTEGLTNSTFADCDLTNTKLESEVEKGIDKLYEFTNNVSTNIKLIYRYIFTLAASIVFFAFMIDDRNYLLGDMHIDIQLLGIALDIELFIIIACSAITMQVIYVYYYITSFKERLCKLPLISPEGLSKKKLLSPWIMIGAANSETGNKWSLLSWFPIMFFLLIWSLPEIFDISSSALFPSIIFSILAIFLFYFIWPSSISASLMRISKMQRIIFDVLFPVIITISLSTGFLIISKFQNVYYTFITLNSLLLVIVILIFLIPARLHDIQLYRNLSPLMIFFILFFVGYSSWNVHTLTNIRSNKNAEELNFLSFIINHPWNRIDVNGQVLSELPKQYNNIRSDNTKWELNQKSESIMCPNITLQNLSGLKAEDATFVNCKFNSHIMKDANLANSNFNGSVFSNVDLSYTNASSAPLLDSPTKFQGTMFSDTNMTYSRWFHVDFSNAFFSNINTENVSENEERDFNENKQFIGNHTNKVYESVYERAVFGNIEGGIFYQSNLNNAIFNGYIRGTSFYKSTLLGAKFNHTNFAPLVLYNAYYNSHEISEQEIINACPKADPNKIKDGFQPISVDEHHMKWLLKNSSRNNVCDIGKMNTDSTSCHIKEEHRDIICNDYNDSIHEDTTKFVFTRMREAKFSGVINNIDFEGANLGDAAFCGEARIQKDYEYICKKYFNDACDNHQNSACNIKNVTFENTDLSGANFCSRMTRDKDQDNPHTKIDECSIKNVTFKASNLSNADFSDMPVVEFNKINFKENNECDNKTSLPSARGKVKPRYECKKRESGKKDLYILEAEG